MKKVKVRIYKDPNNQGSYINKTSKFLQKAQGGMQVGAPQQDIVDVILDELTLDPDADLIASKIQDMFGINYFDAMDKIDEVVSMLYKQDTQNAISEAEVIEDETTEEPVTPPLYNINDPWVSEETEEDAVGWGDELAFNEDNIEDSEEMKKGGSISKKKFVKTVVRGLKKAAEGMEQETGNTAGITDIPIGGRQSLVNSFRRGVKDLGNEYYAKQIFDKTQQITQNPEAFVPMAQEGLEMNSEAPTFQQSSEMDTENPMHHLQAYTGTTSNIFKQPMTDTHGPGYEMPQARKGREQRAEARQQNQVNKDWQKAFGDMAVGYMGVPGLPNYLQIISPQIVQGQAEQNTQMPAGPNIDFEYKKGPWWSGKREWSAKGIPAEMLMGMGMGSSMMPGMRGYNTGYYNMQEESYNFPGKIVKKQAQIINSQADPTKSNTNVVLNNNPAAASTNTEWQKSLINPNDFESASSTYFNMMPDFKKDASGATIYSGPDSEEEYNAVMDILRQNNYDLSVLTPEQLAVYENSGQIVKDSQGNEYSTQQGWGSPEYEANLQKAYNNYEQANQLAQFTNQLYPVKAFGGPVTNPQMDPMGNLQKFVYGGDEMSISPIVEYDNNDIQSKDVDDPFMFRRGGLMKADNGFVVDTSKMNPANNQVDPAFQSPVFQQYNQNITSGDNYQAYLDLKNRGIITEAYNPAKIYATAPAGQTTTQQQGQQRQQQLYPDGRGGYSPYPTAPSLRQQIGNMFSPFKMNPYTGKNYDFMWMSQQGPVTTVDGQPFQMPTGQVPGLTGPPEPGKAGYHYDYKLEKGPWWSGKKTMTLTGRWIDPNNPNAASNPNAGGTTVNDTTNPFFKADEDANKIPDYLQAGTSDIGGVEAFERQRSNVKGLEDESRTAIRAGERVMNRNNRRLMRQDPNAFYEGPAEGIMSDEEYMAKVNANKQAAIDAKRQNIIKSSETKLPLEYSEPDVKERKTTVGEPKLDPEGSGTEIPDSNIQSVNPMDYMSRSLSLSGQANPRPTAQNMDLANPEPTSTFNQTSPYGPEESMYPYLKRYPEYAFGGYMPAFEPGGQFSGVGPFDPNNAGVNQGAMGPCEEKDIMDPNSPCYNPNYNSSTLAPQDFSVTYDINKARTLNPDGILNTKQLAGSAIQSVGRTVNNIYNDDYLNARTFAEEREPVNQLDYRGGYSGLNQRIMSKGQGRGSTGFNSVVGNAAFVKRGGQLGYQKGGEYDLTQEEIGRILAAGGQIEFI
jgi:hypothetical protein